MADETEVIKIRIEAETDRADNAKQALLDLGAAAVKLQGDMRAAGVATKAQSEEFASLQTQIRGAGSAMDSANSQLNRLGAHGALAGNKFLQLGNTIDDLQYVAEQGLRPIINNVMQLSPALGVAMIAGNLLYKNWDQISAAFKDTPFDYVVAGLEGVKDAMKSLAEKVSFGGLDFKNLDEQMERMEKVADKAKKSAANSKAMPDKLHDMLSDKEEARAAAVKNAIAQDPRGAEGVREDMLRDRLKGLDEKGRNAKVRDMAGNLITRKELITRGVDDTIGGALKGKEGSVGAFLDMAGKGVRENYEKKLGEDALKGKTSQAVSGLQDRYSMNVARGGKATPEMIANELLKTGLAKTREESAKMAPGVLKGLVKGEDETSSKYAAEHGVSQGQARVNIAADENEKVQKAYDDWEHMLAKETADTEKAYDDWNHMLASEAADTEANFESWNHMLAKEAADTQHNYDEFNKKHANEIAAGTAQDERAQNAFVRSQLNGATGQQALAGITDGIKRELMAGGMSEEDAAKEAAERAKKVAEETGDKIAKSGGTEGKASQTIAGQDFAKYLQDGQEPAKKMLSLTESIDAGIKQLVDKRNGLR